MTGAPTSERYALDETHEPSRTSWVEAGAGDAADFPIQNLPFGRFTTRDARDPRAGVAIGDDVLDLRAAEAIGLLREHGEALRMACRAPVLNDLAARPPAELSGLRRTLSRLLARGAPDPDSVSRCLVRRADVQMLLPIDVRNYTDFFTSIDHVRNTSRMVRGKDDVARNFHSLPIAYHGRASTVVVSGTPFHRPHGQFPDGTGAAVRFGPTEKLDFECELGVVVGQGNPMGKRIALADASAHVFGVCLLNDWSARDMQRWEMAPLGPFLSKSFATTISPWIVTLDALAPFRTAAAMRSADAPPLLDHLSDDDDREHGGLDIRLRVSLRTASMRDRGIEAMRISAPKFRDQYWTVFQMLTHHASNGCALLPGDLFGSGTISGRREDELGCLLEMLRDGEQAIVLPNGERRGYLLDGDEVTLTATCEAPGRVTVGFGACSGMIMPALA